MGFIRKVPCVAKHDKTTYKLRTNHVICASWMILRPQVASQVKHLSLSLKDAGDNTQKQTHSTAWSKPTHRSSQCHRHVPTTQHTPWVMCFQFRVVFSFKSAYPEVVLGWTEHSCYPGTPRRSISSFRRQAVVMGAESAMFVRAQTRATIIGIWVKKMPSF